MTAHNQDIRNALGAIDLFEGLSPEHLHLLAEIARLQEYGPGETIFSEGEEASGLYALVTGAVRIFKVSAQGREHVLHFIAPGEAFAEVVVFKGTQFPATAETSKASLLLFLPTRELRRRISAQPDLALSMLALLSQRLRFFVSKIESLSLKETPARLAGHLLLLCEAKKSETFDLDIPKGQLAAYLGTIPETVSRVLRKFAESGLIDVQGGRFRVLNVAALQAIATGQSRL